MFDNSKIEIINSEEFIKHYKHRIIFYNKDKLFFNLSFFQINEGENIFTNEKLYIVINTIKQNFNREFVIIDCTEPIYPYIENIKKFIEICKTYNKSITIISGQNSKDILDLYKSFGANVIFLPLFNFLFFANERINFPFYKENTLEKKFLTLNRSGKKARKLLLEFLKENDLLKFGEYSFLFENIASFNENIDKEDRGAFYMSSVVNDFDFNKKCFLNFVVETCNEDYFIFENKKINTNFVSEKTAKCLRTGLPFILLGESNSLHSLKSYGIKTFDNFWDESYDLELNYENKTKKAFNILKNICYEKDSVLREIYNETENIHKENVLLIDSIMNDNLKILKDKINL
jgi:hypothetical protein